MTFYARLRQNERRRDSDELAACIERVVNQLEQETTTGDRPGMLLGKIQSGKTRGFIGVIARGFDRGFDIALVLTKGTKTLSAQTVARLNADFEEFINEDELLVLDIMKLPGKLTRSELKRKIVIVAKKQAQNLERLIDFIEHNAELQNRRVLLVDDEADLASIRFIQKRGNVNVEQGKIAEKMDNLRRMVSGIAFLQVTATPYSLYLQPEGYEASLENHDYVFKPKKPAFTELLPIHAGYVGGDDYFDAFDEEDPRARLYVEVDQKEQDSLRNQDKQRISASKILNNPNIAGLRRAIITFIISACVRRWQQHEAGERKRKYAMIIHNDTQKQAHAWQEQVIEWLLSGLVKSAESEHEHLRPLFDEAYADLSISVGADKGYMPLSDHIFNEFIDALQGDEVVREKVNSDTDVMALLDQNAELRLRTPYNIFVGGNILDRGITIPNLIAFYYGRNPRTMQADTVLQHSRMYGNRDRRDLAVTRFYTSRAVYTRLYTINKFENALREAFESGAHNQGVVFIQTDRTNGVKPCAPNKVLMSNVVAIKPNGLYLPTDFYAKAGQEMVKRQIVLDNLILPLKKGDEFIEIGKNDALKILSEIEKSLELNSEDFEWGTMHGLLEYYASQRGRVLLLIEMGRKIDRKKSGDKSGLSILGADTRKKVAIQSRSEPALVLLQQEGSLDLNWSGHKFWWPILAAPATVEPCIFASKVAV
jgi:hypothetical protein